MREIETPRLAHRDRRARRELSVGRTGNVCAGQSELREDPGARELGDVLFAAVGAARAVGADPELALRASAQRFRGGAEAAAALAAAGGEDFTALTPERQLRWYEEARSA